jgi:hypothetical protein
MVKRIVRTSGFRLWPKRIVLLAKAEPFDTGLAVSWLSWYFVLTLPSGYR